MAELVKDKALDFNVEKDGPAVDTSRIVRVGIIGCGWIAGSHIEQYIKMEDVEIVAAADLVPGKAEAFFQKRGVEGVRCYPDHKSMIDNEELDAVCVCTYNNYCKCCKC